jgi:hypothetical protein
MQSEIVADAKARGHKPGPWVETSASTFACVCEVCGLEAVVLPDGECEIDNMQIGCGAEF